MQLNRNIAVSETGFIFNPSSGDSFSVNPVGQDAIRLLKEGKTREEITNALVEKYAIDAASVDKDMDDFFVMLRNYQLLTGHE
jgi:hypothetical protein